MNNLQKGELRHLKTALKLFTAETFHSRSELGERMLIPTTYILSFAKLLYA